MDIKEKLYKSYINNLVASSTQGLNNSFVMWFNFTRKDYDTLIEFLSYVLLCERDKIYKLSIIKNIHGIMTIALSIKY